MSVELMLWREPEPITRDLARKGYLAAKKDAPGGTLPPYAGELPGKLTAYTGGHVLVTMDLESMDEMSGRVFAVAGAHGLVCYDPQRDLVHNAGPRGAYAGMQLHTGDGMIVTDPDLGLVHDALATLSAQNPFVALVNFGRHFMQVSPEPGGYELEYKEGGTLHRTLVPDLAEIQRAFGEYARDERGFLTRLAWSS
ncbi:hypothetical protein ACFWYW_01440 [Nonomuraea sp. NPDC059023]|uniref:hypothetical protein n=1 Tax=unclassified Nonomuraea TaxID=2593643 RepID=UPI0036C39400